MSGLARISMHTSAIIFSYLELPDHISLSCADHHCHAVSCTGAASPVQMSVTRAGALHIEADAAPRAFLRKRPGKLVWAGATRDARWRAAFASSLHTLVVTHRDMSWLDHTATSLLSRLHTFKQVCAYPDFRFGTPAAAATDQKGGNGDGDDGRTADDYWNAVLRLPSLTRLMIQAMSADAFGRLGACAGLRHLVLNANFADNEMRRPPSILQSPGAVRRAVATLERLETLEWYGNHNWFQQYPLRLAPLEFDEWLTKLPSLTELRGTLLCVPSAGPLEIGRVAATRLRRCGSVSAGRRARRRRRPRVALQRFPHRAWRSIKVAPFPSCRTEKKCTASVCACVCVCLHATLSMSSCSCEVDRRFRLVESHRAPRCLGCATTILLSVSLFARLGRQHQP